jgi:hypothetical protein
MSEALPPIGDNPDQRPAESIFAKRSGILDPLRRSASPLLEQEAGKNWGQRPDADFVNGHDTDGFAGDGDYSAAVELDDPTVPEEQIYRSEEELYEHDEQLRRAREHQKMLCQRRQRKKRQVFLTRVRLLFKLAFAGVMMFGLWQVLHNPFWRLDQPRFSLENNHLLTRTQILPFLAPVLGKPLPEIDVGRLAAQIQKRYPVAERVVMRRRLFPARLTVIVREKMPWAQISATTLQPSRPKQSPIQKVIPAATLSPPVWQEKETLPAPIPMPVPLILSKPYALLTEKGTVALAASAHLAPYTPRLYPNRRIEALILQPGTRYRTAYLNRLRQFIGKVRSIQGLTLLWTDARQPERVMFHFREIDVVLGRLNDSAEHRLLRIAAVLPRLKEIGGIVDAVDLQWEEQVTLHTRPNVRLQAPERPKTDG